MSEAWWSLLIGGVFGLAAAWGPIAITSRANQRRRRAALAAELLTQGRRLVLLSQRNRVLITHTPRKVPLDTLGFDHVMPALTRAAYELVMITKDRAVIDKVNELVEIADEFVVAAFPKHASDEELLEIARHAGEASRELVTLLSPGRRLPGASPRPLL